MVQTKLTSVLFSHYPITHSFNGHHKGPCLALGNSSYLHFPTPSYCCDNFLKPNYIAILFETMSLAHESRKEGMCKRGRWVSNQHGQTALLLQETGFSC